MTRPRLAATDLANLEPIDAAHEGPCDGCGFVDDLEQYDNGAIEPHGWLCGECIGQAEMEL